MPAPSQHAFSEKVALITDGTNPIGRAAAMQLALYGCYVIVGVSHSDETEKQTLNELKSLGTLAHFVETDFENIYSAENLVGEVENLYGRLDLLVNCLKSDAYSEFEEISEETFDEIININLKGTFFITRKAVELMKARPKPKIVNIFSACDTKKAKKNPAAAATAAALSGWTKDLAEILPENFRVNGVAVSDKQKKTSHFDKFSKADDELFRRKTGLETDDIARTITYLLSAEAVGLNGQILKVG